MATTGDMNAIHPRVARPATRKMRIAGASRSPEPAPPGHSAASAPGPKENATGPLRRSRERV